MSPLKCSARISVREGIEDGHMVWGGECGVHVAAAVKVGGRVASWIMHVDPHDYNNTTERTRNDLGAHWVTRTVTRTDRPSFTPTERNTLA